MAGLLSNSRAEVELGERPTNSSHLPEPTSGTQPGLNHVSTVLGDAFYTQQRSVDEDCYYGHF